MTLTTTDTLLAQWATWQRAQGNAESTIASRATRVRKLEQHSGTPAVGTTVDGLMSYIASVPSRSTKATYWSHLRAWFKWLQRAGHRLDDPTALTRGPRPPRRTPRPVADEHLPRLLAQRMWPRTRVMILLACLAGLRVADIAAMHGGDVDLIAGTIRVRGKGDVEAWLPLHPLLAEAALAMPRRGWWFPTNAPGNKAGHGHVQPQSVSRIVGDAMRRAEVPGSAHSLRHWFGTTLVDEGTDLLVTSDLLRHASTVTTQVYARVPVRARVAAVAKLDPWRAARDVA